jgi:FtsP/CotA-like multicopper oxidase with cupredoxin domain
LHIHGHVWQLIESEGQALEAQSFRDTAVVPGLSKIKLALVADNVGLWVLQSLLAERVDSGLLGAFTVAEIP